MHIKHNKNDCHRRIFQLFYASMLEQTSFNKNTAMGFLNRDYSIFVDDGTDGDLYPSFNRLSLWSFIFDLLEEERSNCVRWTDRENLEFKVEDTDGLAHEWGRRKGRNSMTWPKFARAMRYYYGKGVLEKVERKRFTYKFINSTKTRDVFNQKQREKNCLSTSRSPNFHQTLQQQSSPQRSTSLQQHLSSRGLTYSQQLSPQSSPYNQQLSPQTSAYNQQLSPQASAYNQQLSPQASAYNQQLSPQSQTYNQQASPQGVTSLYSSFLPPSTGSFNLPTSSLSQTSFSTTAPSIVKYEQQLSEIDIIKRGLEVTGEENSNESFFNMPTSSATFSQQQPLSVTKSQSTMAQFQTTSCMQPSTTSFGGFLPLHQQSLTPPLQTDCLSSNQQFQQQQPSPYSCYSQSPSQVVPGKSSYDSFTCDLFTDEDFVRSTYNNYTTSLVGPSVNTTRINGSFECTNTFAACENAILTSLSNNYENNISETYPPRLTSMYEYSSDQSTSSPCSF